MKVLWLVSITIPAAADACGLQAKEIGGGWLSGALGGMTAAPDAPAITVASVDARAETLTVCSKNGVSFALLPTGSVETFSALLKKIAPDLVHIWGTEYAAARTIQQAAQAAGIPVLVGIQGVMVDCALHLNDGVPARLLHSCAAQHLIDRHVPGGLLDVNQARFDTLAQSEAAVLANARHVTGRTSFDRSAVQKLAPQASYYPCNETLRPEFYTPPVWHPRTFGEAPVLLLSQGNYPLKNLHTVLKALPAVLAQYPGAVLRVVPPQAPTFQPNLDAFAQMLTEKVTCVLINTPNNPTGVVYSADTLTRMAAILTEKSAQYGHNIFLVSDEPYRNIVFDGKTVPYPAAFYPHTLTCFSYSKSLSLPGERLGYVAVRPGCEGEDILVDMMSQISRFTGHNCPPSIIQRAVSRCQKVTSDLSVYQTNMELLYEKLTTLGFAVERPGGTFYIFPKALEEDANAFCQKAREFDLLLVPSDSFGVKGYVRLAYCIDTEKVKRSLPALEKLAAAYQ